MYHRRERTTEDGTTTEDSHVDFLNLIVDLPQAAASYLVCMQRLPHTDVNTHSVTTLALTCKRIESMIPILK